MTCYSAEPHKLGLLWTSQRTRATFGMSKGAFRRNDWAVVGSSAEHTSLDGLKQLAAETENWQRISGVIARVLSLEGER
jgi:hypothetical protein